MVKVWTFMPVIQGGNAVIQVCVSVCLCYKITRKFVRGFSDTYEKC